jgi:hypothetical protein
VEEQMAQERARKEHAERERAAKTVVIFGWTVDRDDLVGKLMLSAFAGGAIGIVLPWLGLLVSRRFAATLAGVLTVTATALFLAGEMLMRPESSVIRIDLVIGLLLLGPAWAVFIGLSIRAAVSGPSSQAAAGGPSSKVAAGVVSLRNPGISRSMSYGARKGAILGAVIMLIYAFLVNEDSMFGSTRVWSPLFALMGAMGGVVIGGILGYINFLFSGASNNISSDNKNHWGSD